MTPVVPRAAGLVAWLLVVLALGFGSGCESETRYGRCVGLQEADRDPALHYDLSVRNTVLGVVFSETVIVPLVVVFSELYCPVGAQSRPVDSDCTRGGGR